MKKLLFELQLYVVGFFFLLMICSGCLWVCIAVFGLLPEGKAVLPVVAKLFNELFLIFLALGNFAVLTTTMAKLIAEPDITEIKQTTEIKSSTTVDNTPPPTGTPIPDVQKGPDDEKIPDSPPLGN